MKRLCWFFVCLLAVDSASVATTTRAPDEICKNVGMFGLIEINCWGYKECVNGAYIEHKCPVGQLLDMDSRRCLPRPGVSCDPIRFECTGLPDAFYSDYSDNCKTYYRCYQDLNIGQFYCSGGLVFNEDIQTCASKSDVPPPCGTKRPETTATVT